MTLNGMTMLKFPHVCTLSSCPQAWPMSQWIFVQVPQTFVPRNFCSGICLHWSACKVDGRMEWLYHTWWFFLHHTCVIQGQLKVTQESQVTGPCIGYAQMHNSPHTWDYDIAQSNHDTPASNSPNTWEHNTAQPLTPAQSGCSLCNFNCHKNKLATGLRLLQSSSQI